MRKLLPYISFSVITAISISSCKEEVKGCTDPNSASYNPLAEKSDGSCVYPSSTKKAVCFFFTDSDNNTCGSFGIDLLDQVKATNPVNTYFISVHPNATDTLFAAAGIDVAAAFSVMGFPDFGVGDQAGLLTQTAILNAIASETAETPQGSVDASYTTTTDSIIVTLYGKFFTFDTCDYFVTAYVIEDDIVANQTGNSATYHHKHVLRAASGASGIGDQVNSAPVGSHTSFKIRSGIYRNPAWNMGNVTVLGVLWRQNGTDFEYINAGN